MAAQVIDRGRGPEIAGTRITVYRIMDFLQEASSPECIAEELNLTSEELQAALDYIDAHRESVVRDYHRILQGVQQSNSPQAQSGRARSIAELQQRMATRRGKGVTSVDSGR